MKFLFVTSECENYAVMLFSRLLKDKGHDVHMLFESRLFSNDEIAQPWLARMFDIQTELIQQAVDIAPDIIGFSIYTQDSRWAYRFATRLKECMPNTPIIFGGIHCILCPEEVISQPAIDYVCVAEGEDLVLQISDLSDVTLLGTLDMANLVKGAYNPTHVRFLALKHDPDTLPAPDKDILYDQKPVFKDGYTISTSRGCPYACTFCASDALNTMYREKKLGNPVRKRSVPHVMTELIDAKYAYNYKTVYFTDDNFTMGVGWLLKFAYWYKFAIDVPFYCTANPGAIKDQEIELLAQAGCQMIGFGLQSTDEKLRKEVLNRRGTNERIKRVCELCHRVGIHFSFDHIFGIPGDSDDNQQAAIEFYNETRPAVINTFTLVYLPKTKLKPPKETVRTSMIRRESDCYSSMFSLLPLLPSKLVTWLVTTGAYKYIKLPYIVKLLLKDIKRTMIGRHSDVWFPIRLILVNMRDNLWIKLKSSK